MNTAGLILAAGKGTRFRLEQGDPTPKVLRLVLGRPMVSYVVDTLVAAGVERIAFVVGYRAQDVVDTLGESFAYALQEEQKGSGHAVSSAKDIFRGFAGDLVIMCGDSPLFRPETVREMVRVHDRSGAAVTLASAALDDPTGYGRILRDGDGRVVGVVEERCANESQRAIREVNGGTYVLDAPWLFANIHLIARNEAGEYNLTSMVRVAIEQQRIVEAVPCDPVELLGVNTPEQLSIVEGIIKKRQQIQ